MSYGLQTFKPNGDVSFDSQSGNLRVVEVQRVKGTTSFTVGPPPPYTLMFNIEYPRFAYLDAVSKITLSNVGNRVYVNYEVYNGGAQGNSVSLPCVVMVLK